MIQNGHFSAEPVQLITFTVISFAMGKNQIHMLNPFQGCWIFLLLVKLLHRHLNEQCQMKAISWSKEGFETIFFDQVFDFAI